VVDGIFLAGRPIGTYVMRNEMKLRRKISDGALARMREEALAFWRRGDFDQYFSVMERAQRMDPANSGLLLDLGAAHGMRYDYAAANRCFERAVKLAPDKQTALIMAGVQCRGFDRYEMARDYFEMAVRERGVAPDTLVKLAEIYERFRMLPEAAVLVERALQLDAGCALASLVRARLDRLEGRVEEAERRLRLLLNLTDKESWSTRVRGWYELGAVLDAQGRYDEAMEAFLKAKEMIRPGAARFIAGQKLVHTRLREIGAEMRPEMPGRWRGQAATLLPARRVGLLCGHPRSGTTLLEQVLDSHPEVVSVEESGIFLREAQAVILRSAPPDRNMMRVLDAASPEVLRQARDAYSGCMVKFLGQPWDNRLVLDKNPALTGLIPSFTRVFPEMKLLVALRDPRDVCLSCFMQPLPLGQVSSSFLTLEGSVQEYAAIMGFWRTVKPCLDNAFLEVRYEDLVADLEGVSRRALDYLGLEWNERVLRFNEHAGKKLVRSPTYAAVVKPIFKGAVGRWRNYQKYLEPWLEVLAPFVRAFGYE